MAAVFFCFSTMKLIRTILSLLVFWISFSAFSQDKTEREVKIKSSQVPIFAKEWLSDAFENLRKPKWYLEYSQKGKAFEAKFSRNGHLYSVEFDSLGKLEDVEIEILYSEIPTETWTKIRNYFSDEFKEISVQKIQRQLIGSESDLKDFFHENESERITVQYEIVFQGKNDSWQVWEGLFDEKGSLISIIRVQLRPLDNLVF